MMGITKEKLAETIANSISFMRRSLGIHEHDWSPWRKVRNTWYQTRHCHTCQLVQERGISDF